VKESFISFSREFNFSRATLFFGFTRIVSILIYFIGYLFAYIFRISDSTRSSNSSFVIADSRL